MYRSKLFRSMAAPVLLALLISLVFATPAFADDGIPPTETPTEVTPPDGGDPTQPTEEATAHPEGSDQPQVPVETPAPSEPPVTTEQILNAIPEDTQVVVIDETGTTLPLASQAAEKAISNGDPIWCPVGVAPGGGGCSPNFSIFGSATSGNTGTELLAWLDAHDIAKPGVIWIGFNYASGPEPTANDNITINGDDFTNLKNAALTLQGGWNGTLGSKGLNSTTPYSTFNASLSIFNWQGMVTLNDIVVTGIVNNPTLTAALYVESTKNITLNRVQVKDNYVSGYYGALLDTAAAPLGAPAAVTVNDSMFNDNLGTGITIYANGPVKIKNITANYNGVNNAGWEYGLYIDNFWTNLNQPVTFTGTNEFKGNLGIGLHIDSYGAVTLNNISASFNNDGSNDGMGDGQGVMINNNIGTTASNVMLTGTNLITFNQVDGLVISSNGNISVSNLTASHNGNPTGGGDGAELDNCINAGSGCTILGKSVTLTGTNDFNNNQVMGLIVNASGVINLSNVTANSNTYDDGIDLNNCNYSGSECSTLLPYSVTITGYVTTNKNGGGGMVIYTMGPVALSNVTASYNGGLGVYIENDFNLLKQNNVTLSGFNNFNYNTWQGLDIESYGTISLSNVTANYNGLTGVFIANPGFNTGAGASILPVRKNVILSGTNTFVGNAGNGLNLISAGTITLSNITANYNTGNGVYLNNQSTWKPNGVTQVNFAAPITINGFGTFIQNGNDGLDILSHGIVTLKNIAANDNYKDGARIETYGFSGPQTVTLAGVNNFINNGHGSGIVYGLSVINDGVITISNLTASSNAYYGAYLNNYNMRWTGKFLGVTLTGFNTFQANGYTGLFIATDGTATLNHVNADRNGGSGMYVFATRNITLICGSAYDNTSTGAYLHSGATLTIRGLQAMLNFPDEELAYVILIRTVCP